MLRISNHLLTVPNNHSYIRACYCFLFYLVSPAQLNTPKESTQQPKKKRKLPVILLQLSVSERRPVMLVCVPVFCKIVWYFCTKKQNALKNLRKKKYNSMCKKKKTKQQKQCSFIRYIQQTKKQNKPQQNEHETKRKHTHNLNMHIYTH